MAGRLPLAILEAVVAAFTSTPVQGGLESNRLAAGQPAIAAIERALAASDDATVTIYGADLPLVNSGVDCQLFKADGSTTKFDLDKTNGGTGTLYVAFSNYNVIVLLNGQVVPKVPAASANGYTVTDNLDGTNAAKPLRVAFSSSTHSGDGSTTAFTTTLSEAARALTGMTLSVKVGGVAKALTTDYTLSVSAGRVVVTFLVAPANSASNTVIALVPASGARVEVYKVTPVAVQAATAAATAFKEAAITCKQLMWGVVAGSNVGATNLYIRPLAN